MHKRNTLSKWKMGMAVGFGVPRYTNTRCTWLEFLPLFGLLLTAGFLASVAGWWMLPAAYGVALLLAAGQGLGGRWLSVLLVYRCARCRTAVLRCLADGLFRRGRLPTDRG